MQGNVKKQDSFLYLLLLCMPFVDMLTGALLNAGSDSLLTKVGQAYRIVFLLYLAYIVYLQDSFRTAKWLFIFSVYMGLLVGVYHFRFGSPVTENLSYCVKLLFPVYVICGAAGRVREGRLDISRIFTWYAWIYPLSLLIPRCLGLGYYNYSYAHLDVAIADSGYKGFYYASNEVNVILVALFVHSFGRFFSKPGVSCGLQTVLLIAALLLMGTKTSILAIPLVIVLYLILQGKGRRHMRWVWVVLGSAAAVLAGLVVFVPNLFAGVIERFAYQYQLYAGSPGALLTFLCSERNLRILPAVQHWFLENSQGIVNLLFGIGKTEKCPNNSIYGLHAIIEMDFFDVLFWFGLIAALTVLLFYVWVWVRSLKKKGAFPEKLAYLLMLAFSMIAGHVLMSACAGTMLGLLGAVLCSTTERR